METLFISHNPHEAHLEFAKSVGARIKITPFNGMVNFSKKWRVINYVYPAACILYGLFLKINEDVVLLEGGKTSRN